MMRYYRKEVDLDLYPFQCHALKPIHTQELSNLRINMISWWQIPKFSYSEAWVSSLSDPISTRRRHSWCMTVCVPPVRSASTSYSWTSRAHGISSWKTSSCWASIWPTRHQRWAGLGMATCRWAKLILRLSETIHHTVLMAPNGFDRRVKYRW